MQTALSKIWTLFSVFISYNGWLHQGNPARYIKSIYIYNIYF